MKCEIALQAHVQWKSATAIWVRTQMQFGVANICWPIASLKRGSKPS
jgi:hypothetical protein